MGRGSETTGARLVPTSAVSATPRRSSLRYRLQRTGSVGRHTAHTAGASGVSGDTIPNSPRGSGDTIRNLPRCRWCSARTPTNCSAFRTQQDLCEDKRQQRHPVRRRRKAYLALFLHHYNFGARLKWNGGIHIRVPRRRKLTVSGLRGTPRGCRKVAPPDAGSQAHDHGASAVVPTG